MSCHSLQIWYVPLELAINLNVLAQVNRDVLELDSEMVISEIRSLSVSSLM